MTLNPSSPPPLVRRSTTSEIFETGIKAIDVLVPQEPEAEHEPDVEQESTKQQSGTKSESVAKQETNSKPKPK